MGGGGWMWGPSACPRSVGLPTNEYLGYPRGSAIHPGQAQGPYPTTTLHLVPTPRPTTPIYALGSTRSVNTCNFSMSIISFPHVNIFSSSPALVIEIASMCLFPRKRLHSI